MAYIRDTCSVGRLTNDEDVAVAAPPLSCSSRRQLRRSYGINFTVICLKIRAYLGCNFLGKYLRVFAANALALCTKMSINVCTIVSKLW